MMKTAVRPSSTRAKWRRAGAFVRLGIRARQCDEIALAAIRRGPDFRDIKKENPEGTRIIPPDNETDGNAERRRGPCLQRYIQRNPDSMISALKTLASAKVSGKKIAVLADMRELGDHAIEEHRRVGQMAAQLGVDYVLTYGELARRSMTGQRSQTHFTTNRRTSWRNTLPELMTPGDAVLVKGSRGY